MTTSTEATNYAAMTDDELNLLVLEKVLGYEWWVSESSGSRCLFAPGKKSKWFTKRATGEEKLVRDWDFIQVNRLPDCLTDAAAWMLVVEEMRKRWKGTSRYWLITQLNDNKWSVDIMWAYGDDRNKIEDDAEEGEIHPSLFRATCIAALKWMEANHG